MRVPRRPRCGSLVPGGLQPRSPRCRGRTGGSEPAPARPGVCLEVVECCPSACDLNVLPGGNPTLIVKWEDEKCVF